LLSCQMSSLLGSLSSSSQWAKAFAILLLVAVSCHAQICTPETCPEGPVEAYFLTTDCSDPPTFYHHVPDFPYGECVRGGENWMRFDLTDRGEKITTVDNSMCDITLSNATYSTVLDLYSACRTIGGPRKDELASYRKFILLSNVNATFASPQVTTVSSTYPSFNEIVFSEMCPSVDNCTYRGQQSNFWTTDHNETCYPLSATAHYNLSLDGSCYRFNLNYYLSFHCVDEHTVASTQFVGEGCVTPFTINVERKVCNSVHAQTTYCMATLNPSSPLAATPSSSSSSLIPTSLFIIVLGALLF